MQSSHFLYMNRDTVAAPHLHYVPLRLIAFQKRRKQYEKNDFSHTFGENFPLSLVLSNVRDFISLAYLDPLCGNNDLILSSKLSSTYTKENFFCHCVKCSTSCEALSDMASYAELELVGNALIHGKPGTGKSACGEEEHSEIGYDNGTVEGRAPVARDMLREEGKNSRAHNSQLCTEFNPGPRISFLARSLILAKTAEDVEEVLDDREMISIRTCGLLIRSFALDKNFDSAFALFQWIKKKATLNIAFRPDNFIYNGLLLAMKNANRFGNFHMVIQYMASQGVIPDVSTYNMLLSIYLQKGQPEKGLGVLREVFLKGITPSFSLCINALVAYRNVRDGEGALRFFIEIREKYPTIKGRGEEKAPEELDKLETFTCQVCCQVMCSWLAKGNHLNTRIIELLRNMDRAGVHVGHSKCKQLLYACMVGGHYIVVKELYRRLREQENKITLPLCNHVIRVMCWADKFWAALQVFQDLREKGPQPNVFTQKLIARGIGDLLTQASHEGRWRWSIRLLNIMQNNGLRPDTKHWDAVLAACSRASQPFATLNVFRRMVDHGDKPTTVSYTALVRAFKKGKMYNEAIVVLEYMCRVQPTIYALTVLSSIYIAKNEFDKVNRIMDEMISSGFTPTTLTYNTIISAFSKKKMASTAFEWFQRMEVQGIKPNKRTYAILVAALAKDGKPRLAHEMYMRACNEEMKPVSEAYDILVKSVRQCV